MNNTQTQTQIDPTALALSRSIRAAEGGSYDNSSGDAGTSAGAYQFNNGKIPLKKGEVPANFKSWATEEGLDPNDFSQTNQDHVAYARIKKKLDAGQSQSSIAAEWNSGLKSNWENHKGTTTINGKTISYDTPTYVAKVQKEYEKQINGDGTSNNVSRGTSQNDLTKDKIVDTGSSAPDQTANTDTTAPGTFLSNLGKGKFGDALQSGVRDVGNALTFGGSEQLGKQVGTGLAAIPAATKDLFTGSNDSQYHDQPNLGDTVAGVAKTVGGIGLLAGGGLIGDLIKGKSALQAPEVVSALENTLGKGETIADLSRQDAINALGNTLKEQSVSEAGGKTEQAILKALKALNPTLIEKQNFLVKLAKGGFNLAKGALLAKVFGDTVGGLIHRNTQ